MHLKRFRRHGDPLARVRGEKGRGWIQRGYQMATIDGRRVYVHRYVMEQHLGRPLLPFPDEVIHHVNGDKLDNRIENLVVLTQAEHSSIPHLTRRRDDDGQECCACLVYKPYAEYHTRVKAGRVVRLTKCKACVKIYNAAYWARTHPSSE